MKTTSPLSTLKVIALSISFIAGVSAGNAAHPPPPITEGFETDLGIWTQSPSDDGDWTRHTGSTASSTTGPDAAYEGSYYLYLETSTGGVDGVAALDGQIDFYGLTRVELKFAYSMYGSNTGNLRIDVHDGTSWHDGVWTRTGEQHTDGATWTEETVDLSMFAGLINVTVRFRAEKGSGYWGDIAIDNISMRVPAALPADNSARVEKLKKAVKKLKKKIKKARKKNQNTKAKRLTKRLNKLKKTLRSL